MVREVDSPVPKIVLALSRAKLLKTTEGANRMAGIAELHKKWMKEAKYRRAYEALEEEFALASALIGVRSRAGLTQKKLARKMGTTQPVVARLESGRARPSMRTLERFADATGSRLLISFAPREQVHLKALKGIQRGSSLLQASAVEARTAIMRV